MLRSMLPWPFRRRRVTTHQTPASEPQITKVQVEPLPPSSTPNTRRDWAALGIAGLPGLAAIIALIFTAQSLQATDRQLVQGGQQVSINSQAEITDRFNAAVTNLASSNVVIQLGGIYALQQIMADSPQEQPAVLDILCGYIRYHDPFPITAIALHPQNVISHPVSADVQAALTVVGARDPVHDGPATVDLETTNLAGADLAGASFANANLEGADLTDANLDSSNFSQAHLEYVNLTNAELVNTNLQGTDLRNSSLKSAQFQNTHLHKALLTSADLSGDVISDSDFSYTNLEYAQLQNTYVSNSNLSDTYLVLANLRQAFLFEDNITYANLAYTQLQGAGLQEVNLKGATLSKNELSDTKLYSGVDLANTHITSMPPRCVAQPQLPQGPAMTEGDSRISANSDQKVFPC